MLHSFDANSAVVPAMGQTMSHYAMLQARSTAAAATLACEEKQAALLEKKVEEAELSCRMQNDKLRSLNSLIESKQQQQGQLDQALHGSHTHPQPTDRLWRPPDAHTPPLRAFRAGVSPQTHLHGAASNATARAQDIQAGERMSHLLDAARSHTAMDSDGLQFASDAERREKAVREKMKVCDRMVQLQQERREKSIGGLRRLAEISVYLEAVVTIVPPIENFLDTLGADECDVMTKAAKQGVAAAGSTPLPLPAPCGRALSPR